MGLDEGCRAASGGRAGSIRGPIERGWAARPDLIERMRLVTAIRIAPGSARENSAAKGRP